MAGEYDINSQVTGYGSPGASALFGVQQELMRRAQVEELARTRQLAEQRQAAQDALNAEHVRQEIAASKENTAANSELRAQNAAHAAETTKEAQLKGITSSLRPGEVDPTAMDAVAKIDPQRAALLFAKTTTPAMPASQPLASDEAGPSQPAVPEKTTTIYKGDAEQQATEEHKKFAQEVVNGEHDTGNESVDAFMHAQAIQVLGTGKFGSVPAGVVNGPKSAVESAAARKIQMEDLQAKIDQGYTPTAEESSRLTVWKKYNPNAAEVAGVVADRAGAAADRTDARAEKGQVFATKQAFRKDISAEAAKLDTDLERVDRARTVLASPNFLTDAVAAPEFLQIMAGGMGSGLRMTDAELRRVNEAQTLYNQLVGKVAKVTGLGEQTTIRAEMRKQMQTMLDTVEQARTRKAKLQQETLRKLDSASTPEEVDKLHADYWEQKQAAASTATKPSAVLPLMKPVTSRQRVPEF